MRCGISAHQRASLPYRSIDLRLPYYRWCVSSVRNFLSPSVTSPVSSCIVQMRLTIPPLYPEVLMQDGILASNALRKCGILLFYMNYSWLPDFEYIDCTGSPGPSVEI